MLRPHPKLAFDVNTIGTYNAIKSAVENGHSRFINTGPHFTVVGYTCAQLPFQIPQMQRVDQVSASHCWLPTELTGCCCLHPMLSDEDYDFDISPEIPAHPGLNLYSLSKGIGQEICRVFADNHPIHVILCLFLSFPAADEPNTVGQGTNPFSVTFADAATCIRKMLEVDLVCTACRCTTRGC